MTLNYTRHGVEIDCHLCSAFNKNEDLKMCSSDNIQNNLRTTVTQNVVFSYLHKPICAIENLTGIEI